ncbi:carbohydrate ABC transporter substrate-binding protein [Firmicutes bacterium AM41-5BH]|nr:carbohydrate ABC transporter substrate-binding protein [Firmicutes bacterium AM41-5BH]
MKRIISIFLTMMLMISTIGCRSKEDDPIEKKDTKVAYQADKIEKPKDISKIQFLIYLEDGTLRIGGSGQSGEERTVWDSKNNGKDWILAGDSEQLPELKNQNAFYKYSSDGKFYVVEDQTIRLYEDTQPSTINIVEGESYLDSALCGQDFYLLVEDETGTKQIRKYDLSEQIWENMENEELVQALKKTTGYGCLAADSLAEMLYTEGEGIVKYCVEKDETTYAINEEVLSGCIDTINEPITGLAVQGENIVVCTAGKSGSESNLYFLQKEQTKKTEKDKTDTGKSTVLKIYSLKENSMIRSSLAFFRREHTDISINYTVGYTGEDGFSVSDAIRKLNTEIMADEGPDIIVLDNLPVEEYISKGVLEPVTDIVNEKKDEIFFNMIEGYNKESEIFCVPTTFRIPVIIGNSEVVSAESSKVVIDQMEQQESPVLTRQDFPYAAMYMFVTSDMVEKDGMNEEKLTAYYNDLLRLKEMGNVTDKIVGESDYSMNQTVDIFPYGESDVPSDIYFGEAKAGVGQIAYADSYIKLNSARKQADIQFDYLNKSGGNYYIPTEVLGINSRSSYKDAAKEFLSLYLTEEVQNTNTMGFSINRNSMRNSAAVTDSPQYYSTIYKNLEDTSGLDLYTLSTDEFNELLQFVELADTPVWVDAVVTETVMEQADKILYEGLDVQTAVKTVCDKIDLYLKE